MRCAASSCAAAAAITALAVTGCNRQQQTTTAVPTTMQAAAPPAMAHGDHNPRHGGVVMMKGEDLHYEVVLDPTGRSHRLFFSDGTREDLPASTALAVSLVVKRGDGRDEAIELAIDEAGESWIGHGAAIADPAHTTARVAFTIRGEPYWIDLPFVERSRSAASR